MAEPSAEPGSDAQAQGRLSLRPGRVSVTMECAAHSQGIYSAGTAGPSALPLGDSQAKEEHFLTAARVSAAQAGTFAGKERDFTNKSRLCGGGAKVCVELL